MDASRVRQYVTLTQRKAALEAQAKSVGEELKRLEDELYGEFASQGIDRLTVDGTTVYLHRQLWARSKDGADRDKIAAALESAGLDHFVSKGFNWNTVSAYVREFDAAGEDIPIELQDVIEVTEVFSVRTRRAG